MTEDGRLPLRVAALVTGLPPVPDSTLLILESIEDSDSVLPVLIGNREGEAIKEGMTQRFLARPTPYDLLLNLLEVGNLEVREVFIDKIKDGAYHAKIVVAAGERTVHLDSRTSDGVAIALRTHAPLFVSTEVFDEAKRPREEFQAVISGHPTAEEDEEGRAFKEALEGLEEIDLGELGEADSGEG